MTRNKDSNDDLSVESSTNAGQNRTERLAGLLPGVLLFAAWLIAEFLVKPTGNFPLNDDWNYALSVKYLLENHTLEITCWSLAASLTHIIAGWLFCLPFGFSFENLRLATLLWSLLALSGVYFLISDLTTNKWLPWLSVAVLMTNPLFFELSNTFMTDVPAVALALASTVMLCRQLAKPSPSLIYDLGTSFLVCALCLTRQIGIVIPLAFCLASLSSREFSLRNLTRALLPLLCGVAAITAFQIWLSHSTPTSFSYATEQAYLANKFARGPAVVTLETAVNLLIAFTYMGLFLLPFLPPALARLPGAVTADQWKFFLMLVAEIAILVSGGLLWKNSLMPLADNVLFDWGLGPIFTGGKLAPGYWPTASKYLWVALTIAGVTGGAMLTGVLTLSAIRLRLKQIKLPDKRLLFLLSLLLIYVAVISIRGFFDRYLILPLPLFMAIIVCLSETPETGASNGPASRLLKAVTAITSLALLLAYGTFSVMATHDYFSFNGARWLALNDLTGAGGVPPLKIDGGLEFNGWYAYERAPGKRAIVFDTSMTHGDDFLISLQPKPGYAELRRLPFQRWLTPGTGYILVLKKEIAGHPAAR